MALVAIGGVPLIAIGHANRDGTSSIGSLAGTVLDAANEACIMYGYVWWADGGSHTVNTSGSSALQWRAAASTFANAGTTVKVGLAALDTATGPPARAANSTDVITYDVVASFTGGGGGIPTNSWQTSVPTSGTKTIATGDLVAFAVQMTARAGVDSVQVSCASSPSSRSIPGVTGYTAGSYADTQRFPNAVLTASDGTLGFFFGGYVAFVGQTAQGWNNGSALKEFGNLLRFPIPVRSFGVICGNNFAGDCDLILYSDPLGTPVAQRTISVDSNTVSASNNASDGRFLFSSAYDMKANTDYAVIAKPTTGTSVTMLYKTYAALAHQASEPLGTNSYAVNRDTGAFVAQNSSKDLYAIGLLIGALEYGVQPTYALGI